MKRESLEILCCPSCKGDLKLENASEKDGRVVSGLLICTVCGKKYPVKDGIPDLVP